MPTCPAGHDTDTADYCDVCGAPLSEDVVVMQNCSSCGAPRVGRFCEECGHDSLSTADEVAPMGKESPRQAKKKPEHRWSVDSVDSEAWHAVVVADRDYFDRVVAAGGPDAGIVEFPLYCPERRFVLHDDRITVGRRSKSRGIFPDIDLIGPPEDPGVSASHALLVRTADTWSVVDVGSTNGTTVNDAPLRPHQPHPLADGDHVHLGAWTTLTVHRA